MTRNYLISLILSCCILLISLSGSGQTSLHQDTTVSHDAQSMGLTTEGLKTEALGDHFYNLELYKSALKEYLRAYYNDRLYQNKTIERKASICFQKLQDWDNAIKYQRKYAARNDLDIKEKYAAYYALLQLVYIHDGPKSSLITFYGIPNAVKDYDPDKYHYYEALISLSSEKYEDAKASLASLSYYASIKKLDLEKLMKSLEKNSRKNHNKARWMSAILPGSGQIANGEIWDGINSAVITFAFLYLAVYVGQTLGPIDALLSVGPWSARFYGGGLSNATAASKKKQKKQSIFLMSKLNEVLQKGHHIHNTTNSNKPNPTGI